MNFWLTANLISSEQSPSHLQSCRLWPLAKTGKNRSPFLFRRFLRRLMKIKIDYFISRQSNIWFLTAICFAIAVLQVTLWGDFAISCALNRKVALFYSLLSIVVIAELCFQCWVVLSMLSFVVIAELCCYCWALLSLLRLFVIWCWAMYKNWDFWIWFLVFALKVQLESRS